MSETTDTTPLLPQPVQAQDVSWLLEPAHPEDYSDNHRSQPPRDSHPIYLRACHSSCRSIDQKSLLLLRLAVTTYLTAVGGVSLKYKIDDVEDEHTPWRILFQFSTVSFCLQWGWNILVTLWTAMHLFFPRAIEVDLDDYDGYRYRYRIYILPYLSPPNNARCPIRRYCFSMFYTIAHVFPFMNTMVYWGCLVPAGHGGFKPPHMPHSHTELPYRNHPTARYPNKGFSELEPVDAFSIINVWTITSIIALIEIGFFNCIRRQTPVTTHLAGAVCCSGAYLCWAGLGKLLTGHSGLFFLDPDIMVGMPEAILAACVTFIAISLGVFSFMYGLIAMRETITAIPTSSRSW
ncbi:hypothetical protein F5B19DRAFT_503483 [Rostrohypoxylon terebratum]|nr:hypothetical protein F5B19DRAFT_503483 [Rostrohypoxylon terebratum]